MAESFDIWSVILTDILFILLYASSSNSQWVNRLINNFHANYLRSRWAENGLSFEKTLICYNLGMLIQTDFHLLKQQDIENLDSFRKLKINNGDHLHKKGKLMFNFFLNRFLLICCNKCKKKKRLSSLQGFLQQKFFFHEHNGSFCFVLTRFQLASFNKKTFLNTTIFNANR